MWSWSSRTLGDDSLAARCLSYELFIYQMRILRETSSGQTIVPQSTWTSRPLFKHYDGENGLRAGVKKPIQMSGTEHDYIISHYSYIIVKAFSCYFLSIANCDFSIKKNLYILDIIKTKVLSSLKLKQITIARYISNHVNLRRWKLNIYLTIKFIIKGGV